MGNNKGGSVERIVPRGIEQRGGDDASGGGIHQLDQRIVFQTRGPQWTQCGTFILILFLLCFHGFVSLFIVTHSLLFLSPFILISLTFILNVEIILK